MLGRYPYKKLNKYPHLRPEDVAIWERWLVRYPSFFGRVDYDVKCGRGRSYPKNSRKEILQDLVQLSRLRIDVVGYRANERWVIELKPRAGAGAIGQVMCYASLYKELCESDVRLTSAVITDQLHPDIARVAKSFGVKYIALDEFGD